VIAPYDHEALWTKAKVFLNRAMDPGSLRSFDEQALWATAALELLGKAALARVSPLLIADPTEDGINILIATGLIEGNARFASVSASTIFKRCGKAFRPFNARDAQDFAAARNEYLHGSGLGFMALPQQAWWPRFWALAVILVTAQDRDTDELVGEDRSHIVHSYLDQNSKNVEHRTEALIERSKQRLAQYRAGTLPAKVQLEWNTTADLTADLPYNAPATCPACEGIGTAEGEDTSDTIYEYEFADYEDEPEALWATITVPVDYFSCPTCHLVLDRYELVDHAGVPSTITVIDEDPNPPEPEYGND
jgi:hypothetical protein